MCGVVIGLWGEQGSLLPMRVSLGCRQRGGIHVVFHVLQCRKSWDGSELCGLRKVALCLGALDSQTVIQSG